VRDVLPWCLNAGVGDPDERAPVRIAGVYLINGAPTSPGATRSQRISCGARFARCAAKARRGVDRRGRRIGGYYLASAGRRCARGALVDHRSIGVIRGKLDLSGLFERIGVGLDAVERGARAGMHSAARGFTDEERELVRGEDALALRDVRRRVAEGRGLRGRLVERAARAAVFTGGARSRSVWSTHSAARSSAR